MTYPTRPAGSAGQALNFIGAVSGVVTIVGAGIALMWYVVNVEGRISRLEAQIQTFATAPMVTSRSPTTLATLPPINGKATEAKPAGAGNGSGFELVLNQNPLQNACASVVAKAEQYSGNGYETTFKNTMELFHSLGCDEVIAAAQKK